MATFSVVLSYADNLAHPMEARLNMRSWDDVSYTTFAWFDFDYDKENILEELFRLFNFMIMEEDKEIRPEIVNMLMVLRSTGGRSMSVGDIVSLELHGRVQHFRCMPQGWEVVPEDGFSSLP